MLPKFHASWTGFHVSYAPLQLWLFTVFCTDTKPENGRYTMNWFKTPCFVSQSPGRVSYSCLCMETLLFSQGRPRRSRGFFRVSYSGNARMEDTGVPMFEGAVCEVMINSYWCVCRHLLVGRSPAAVMHMSPSGLGSKSCSGGNNCHSYVLLRHCVINSSFKMNQNHYWVIMPMYMISFPQLYTQR